ncbi:MAG: DUF1640 domain-containing protein [Nitrospinae bacterium]|nr:DUF1640 domain-containing protein [Nitrospinota bacterium]MBI3814316.1 DUF1640 domain-containing protein [Nitrospinota bacterium]
MSVIAIPKPLREKLGDDATDALVAVLGKFEQEAQRGLATKEDIASLKLEIAEIRSELKLLKWMVGIMLAGVISLVIKAFIIIN